MCAQQLDGARGLLSGLRLQGGIVGTSSTRDAVLALSTLASGAVKGEGGPVSFRVFAEHAPLRASTRFFAEHASLQSTEHASLQSSQLPGCEGEGG